MPREFRTCGVAITLALLLANTALGREWAEDVFAQKVSAGQLFYAVADHDPSRAHGVIGSSRFYQVQKKDTFLDVARFYDLGDNEIEDANPGVDQWIPPPGQIIILPTEWVLPDAPYQGLI